MGFVFDGASNIRLLWAICPPMAGPAGEATVVHDWFYSVEGPDIGRLKADYVLYCMARFRGANILEAQHVLINLRHQLGRRGLSGFKRMIKAIHEMDWKEAAKELRDSKLWRADAPARAERLARRLENLED